MSTELGRGFSAESVPRPHSALSTQHSALVIGLTGNIACGKSAVAAMLRDLGAEIIDADKVAHTVMRSPGPVFDEIVHTFGPDIIASDGQIDRRQLGLIVFSHPQTLRQLDAIVRAPVVQAIEKLIEQSTAPVVVIEAIKLIESGLADRSDSVWVVTCRHDQQIERLLQTRGLSGEAAEARIAAQAPLQEKIARADVIIDNSGSIGETRQQVERAWQALFRAPGTAGGVGHVP